MLILAGLIGFSALSGAILSSAYSFADDAVIDDVAIAVPVSCTMLGTGTNSHTANVPNGTYLADIGTTTLKIYCNDSSGFSIYAIGFTGEQYSGDNTKLIGVNSNQMISTGTATSGNTSNWAMKLATNSNATYPITLQNGFGAYSAVPATYTKVATRATATDVGNNATGAELTTTYASYMSSSQVADTYSGKVKYTLVHPANETPLQPQTTQAGKICYYPNGSNVEGTMGCQTIPTSGGITNTVTPTSATLLASNFSREGYGFAGWSKTFDYSDSTGFLGPQEYIEFTEGAYSGNNNGLSLYAHWIESTGDLQGWTGCSSLQSGAVTALTDQRDNETYAVAKLADGNCWMIENLRLEAEDSNDETLAQGFGKSTTYGNFVGLADAENENFTNTNPPVANSLYSPSTDGSKIVIGTNDKPYNRMPRYNNWNTPTVATERPINPTTNGAANSTTNAGMYSYGNYYTWSAALANTIHYDNYSSTDADGKTSETVNTSLCPTGWKLPYSGKNSAGYTTGLDGFYDLLYKINNNEVFSNEETSRRIRAYPNNFLNSGKFVDNTISERYEGYYWSSTVSSGSVHIFWLRAHYGAYPTTGSDKYKGYSIRCMIIID